MGWRVAIGGIWHETNTFASTNATSFGSSLPPGNTIAPAAKCWPCAFFNIRTSSPSPPSRIEMIVAAGFGLAGSGISFVSPMIL